MTLIFGLFLLTLRFISTFQATENSCVAAAVCQLVRGNVHAILGIKTDETHEEALSEMRKYEKFMGCKIDMINKNCDKRKAMCEMKMMDVAKTHGLAKKLDLDGNLLAKCDPKSWHYILFLCDMKNWPADVTSKIPKDYPLCQQVCPAIQEFNTYHVGKGKTEADFSSGWSDYLEMAKNMSLQSPETRNTEKERKTYTTVEYDQDAVGIPYPTINCPEGTWLGDEPGTPLYFAQRTLATARWICETNQTARGGRGFLIAAQFRREKVPRQLANGTIITFNVQEIVDGRYIYGNGERQFLDDENRPFKTETFVGWGTILECPYTTAVCTIQVTRFRIRGKEVVPTNIKLGCCVVPTEKLWLVTAYVPVQYVHSSGQGFYDDRIKTRVRLYGFQAGHRDVERLYFCPPGQFIDKFQAEVFYAAKGSEEAFNFNFVSNRKTIVTLETEFYCNTRDKAFPSRLMTPFLKRYRPFDKYTLWYDIGNYTCPNGLFHQVRLNIAKVWGRHMHCSTDKPDVWTGGEWDYPGYPTTAMYYINSYAGGQGTASCPEGYALCGVGSTRFRGQFAAAIDRPTMPQTDVSLEGSFFRYFCCKVENIDRCDNPKFTIPRIVNKCPTKHVSQPTGCIVDFNTGTSYSRGTSKGEETSSSVDMSFGITVPFKIKGIVDIAATYTHSISSSRGYSFSTSESNGGSAGESVSARFQIPTGSKLIVAQPQVACGKFLLYANQTIDYITPPISCVPKDRYEERIVPIDDQPKPWGGKFNLTVKGHGLELVGFLFPPTPLNVSWEELTEFLKETFARNSELQANRWTDTDWLRADPEVWTKYDSTYTAHLTFDVPNGVIPLFFQVVAECGPNWIVRTKDTKMIDSRVTDQSGAVSNNDRIHLVKPSAYYEVVKEGITVNRKLY